MKYPGEQWTPSNGTEGELFLDQWCRTCARDKSMREGADSLLDLFMAPTKRTVWVNLYQTDGKDFPGTSYLHPSEEEADRAAQEGRLGGRAYPIEVEVAP